MILFVRHWMESLPALGFLGFILIFVPILGMWAVHKYGWEHWAPFDHESNIETPE